MNIPQAIFIEAGHGVKWFGARRDPGAVAGGITERDINISISEKLLVILQEKFKDFPTIIHGVGIVPDLTLDAKRGAINCFVRDGHLNPGKCFTLSIHQNSANSSARGFEIYYKSRWDDNSLLENKAARDIAEEIDKAFLTYAPTIGIPARGASVIPTVYSHHKRLYIQDWWTNGVLIECGFISNQQDRELLLKQPEKVAEAIAHGLLNYFRDVHKLNI